MKDKKLIYHPRDLIVWNYIQPEKHSLSAMRDRPTQTKRQLSDNISYYP